MRIKAISAGPGVYLSCSLFLLSATGAYAADAAWELAPSDAKFMVGVDVRGIRSSSLADSMTEQMRSQMKTQMQMPLAMFPLPISELLQDIDSIFVAANGDMAAPARTTGGKVDSTITPNAAPGPSPKSAPNAGPKAAPQATAKATPNTNPAFLVAVTGTFPDEHLRPLLTGPHPSYKGINVYRGTGQNTLCFAVLNEHTLLLGDEKSIYRAIDRHSVGAKAVGPLFARARELAATNDIWMLARDESGALQKATGPGAIFASELQGFEFGLALRDGMNMDFNLATKTEADAQAMSQLFLSQMQTAVAPKMDPQMAEQFWKKVKVGADGPRMRVQIALTKEELAANIRTMQEHKPGDAASRFAVRSPSVEPGTASAPMFPAQPVATIQPVAPPKPRVIKIYGLDDGVREVNLDRN
jgi:hypothetical protein